MLTRENIGIVVVDMQENYYDQIRNRRIRRIVMNHNELLVNARECDMPVLVFEYLPDLGRRTISEIEERVWAVPRHIILGKIGWNEFDFLNNYPKRPEIWLRENGVNRILVTGLFASGCVLLTGLGAKRNGFEVVSSIDLIYDESPDKGIKKDYERFKIEMIPYSEIIWGLS